MKDSEPRTYWYTDRIFWLGMLAAAVLRLAVFSPIQVSDNVDYQRFFEQGRSIQQGEGFLRGGAPCTFLPPGYPVFLSLVFFSGDSERYIQGIHLLLSLASCCLVYLAILPRSQRLAQMGLFAMALSLPLATWVWRYQSETFAVFVASALAYQVSRYESGHQTAWRLFFIAAIGVFLVLTTPGLVFLVFGLVVCLGWRERRSWPRLLALVGGCLLVVVPWQVHCLWAIGRVVPSILTPHGLAVRGDRFWVRSWLMKHNDIFAAYSVASPRSKEAFDRFEIFDTKVPDWAFSSPDERAGLRHLLERFVNGDVDAVTVEEEFMRAGMQSRHDHPFRYHVALPLIRAGDLWFTMRPGGVVQPSFLGHWPVKSFVEDVRQFGRAKAIRRLVGMATAYVALVLHLAYLTGFLWLAWKSLSTRALVPWAIVLGVLLYSYVSSAVALQDARRNLTFYPFLCFLLFYLPTPLASGSARGRSWLRGWRGAPAAS